LTKTINIITRQVVKNRIQYTNIGLLKQFVACMPEWTYRDVMLIAIQGQKLGIRG